MIARAAVVMHAARGMIRTLVGGPLNSREGLHHGHY
jgi:hypothetical protein